MQRLPISTFVRELEAAYKRGDGYIMGAYGQNPRTGSLDLSVTTCKSSWQPNGWYYTQYSGAQRTQALKWRANCTRVWDCNGLAEGIYQIHAGVCIDSKARYNYQQWCDPKGAGLIPAKYRRPGAAVFWGDSASSIHHVAYLYKPVDAGNPAGDWYIIEARGVMYGVVRTRLNSRRPNYWGLMTRYYDYGADEGSQPAEPHLGDRILKNGCEGEDVRELQTDLIRLGYDCGKWGADGDFCDATEIAVRRFQVQHGLTVDGEAGPLTCAALAAALAALDAPPEAEPHYVAIEGGNCYVREGPSTSDTVRGVAHEGAKLPYLGEISESGWLKITYKDLPGWVSGKYGKLVDA